MKNDQQERKWFAHDPNGYGLTFHLTEEAARSAAEAALDAERDCSGDGWSANVDEVCWGEVRQRATLTSLVETPGGEFDYIADFELRR